MDVLAACMRPVRIRSVKTYSGEVLQNETLVVVVVVVVVAVVVVVVGKFFVKISSDPLPFVSNSRMRLRNSKH
jgi:hypothetical protein